MKKILFFVFFLAFLSCGSNNHIVDQNDTSLVTGDVAASIANTITAADLKHIFISFLQMNSKEEIRVNPDKRKLPYI